MKKGFISAIVVACLSFILALTMGIYMFVSNSQKQEKYLLYVNVPTVTKTVRDDIKAICKKHTDSFTVVEGSGGETNALGGFEDKQTLVYTFFFTNQETIEALAKEILAEIDDSSIIMESVETKAVHSSSGAFSEPAE